MINSKNPFNYLSCLVYLLLTFGFLCFNRIYGSVYPFSVGLFVGALSVGASIFVTPILFLLGFLLQGKTGLLASMGIFSVFFVIIGLIHKKTKKSLAISYTLYTAVGMVGYIILGDTISYIPLEERLIVSAVNVALSLVCSITADALLKKGLKYKLKGEEYACLLAFVIIFGVGVSHFVSPLVWKGISACAILFCCFLFRFGVSTTVSAVLGISLAFYYGNLSLISVFLLWGITCGFLIKFNRFASALALPLTDLLSQLIFSVYNVYQMAEFLPVLISALLFCIIPTKPLSRLKEKLFLFREKQLVRQTINRNKTMLSNRLYELSGIFTEMKCAFNALQKAEISPETAKTRVATQTISRVCEECTKNKRCITDVAKRNRAICKMVDVGFAKGRLTLIDMPKALGDTCARPSDILYALNKALAEYRSYCLEKQNASIGRELLAQEADGVAEILKNLALESGALLSFQCNLERRLSESLFHAGYSVSELLIYGENDNLSISMILTMQEFSLPALQNVISKTVGTDFLLCDKANITDDKTYLIFKKQAPYDAVFGISKAIKEGSIVSGDTHSVIKIDGDKFMIALSDGMGSGENAQKVSSIALSLIESFYKAGLSGNLILNTVNKLLSINAEDNFTALDISVVDLKNCQADFIKYGSPYGFILGERGIKIVEGNSLPLGILDDLKPSVCHTDLSQESMILLVTDGISDAFGSADDLIEFVRSLPALNPQSLTDEILKRALQLSNEKPADDMTALAVRIFKKPSVA